MSWRFFHLVSPIARPKAKCWIQWMDSATQTLLDTNTAHMIPLYLHALNNIYTGLSHLCEPLGFILPFIPEAKISVEDMWRRPRTWDCPVLSEAELQMWTWRQLEHLKQISLPDCYISSVAFMCREDQCKTSRCLISNCMIKSGSKESEIHAKPKFCSTYSLPSIEYWATEIL